MTEVRVSADELLVGAMIAAHRKGTSDRRRTNGYASRRPEHYEEARTWDQEIESTLAEMVVSRAVGRYWEGIHVNGNDAGTDAGAFQVRWTAHTHGHLVIYEEDSPDSWYVLVTGHSPTFRIAGYFQGLQARQDQYWRADVRCPSWWVPQSDLAPWKSPEQDH